MLQPLASLPVSEEDFPSAPDALPTKKKLPTEKKTPDSDIGAAYHLSSLPD